MKPKVVVFDLGKVLLGFDYRIASRRIAERGRLDADAVQRFFEQSPLLNHYESGQITRQEFFDAVRRETGFDGTLEEFGAFFADIFWPIEPMVALHGDLRAAGLPTYIFSNTNDLAIEHINRNFPFMQDFEAHVLSYEVRAMKPAAKIYEVLEQVSGCRGAEVLYLDDRPENVEAGAARGWQVILHTTPEASWARVRELGLVNHP
ncbi:MAG TPA: HAD family phosphatase [Verrucomicrobiae bacterium]